MNRCAWLNIRNPLYLKYHDEEWGIPQHDDTKLLELLILEGFQAGLSWECVLNKREAFLKAYDNFNLTKIISNTNIFLYRLKFVACIKNARIFQKIAQEFGSFDAYIWGFTNNNVIVEPYNLRTTSPLSDAISRDLKKRGMKFVGSTIIYSYLQAIGILNAHGEECDFSKK